MLASYEVDFLPAVKLNLVFVVRIRVRFNMVMVNSFRGSFFGITMRTQYWMLQQPEEMLHSGVDVTGQLGTIRTFIN